MTCTPLFSSLPSAVYIRSDSAKQVAEQSEGCLPLFKACSFVSGGPKPQEGCGLICFSVYDREYCTG